MFLIPSQMRVTVRRQLFVSSNRRELTSRSKSTRRQSGPIYMPELPQPGPYTLPGYGLPVNFEPKKARKVHRSIGPPTKFRDVFYPQQGDGQELFATALDNGATLSLLTLREITMMRFMNQLTDKPRWEEKIFDDKITAKWKAEALATPDVDITEPMVDYCIAELRWRSELFKKSGFVIAYDGDVVKSDSAISGDLKDALKSSVRSLEDIPERHKDWHPGSDEKVLDLVHPSLFPLVYGKTKILPDSTCGLDDCIRRCGEGVVIPVPSRQECDFVRDDLYGVPSHHSHDIQHPTPWSGKYQWLPCQVKLANGEAKSVLDHPGSVPRITSYINNLHPGRHKDLYTIIEQIISRTIPLWNRTLMALSTYGGRGKLNPARIGYNGTKYDSEMSEQGEDEDDDAFWAREQAWREAHLIMPEPEQFEPLEEFSEDLGVSLERDLEERGLQVIVKLANIELTPEKSTYDGGSWHVEGQLNEHICATAIYYYDCENITDSYLSFRQQSNSDIGYSYTQDDHYFLQAIFGGRNYESSIQELGSVLTKEGRLITFPNALQHRVQPFRLADPTRPGHRKILALFLVDPHIQVISTQNIPCQRKDWWLEELQATRSFGKKVPVEVGAEIGKFVEEWPIRMDEAKRMREELMDERKVFVDNDGDWFAPNTFSLCEH